MRRARNGGGGGWLPACRAVEVLLLSLLFKARFQAVCSQRRVTRACSGGEGRAAAWLGPPNGSDRALKGYRGAPSSVRVHPTNLAPLKGRKLGACTASRPAPGQFSHQQSISHWCLAAAGVWTPPLCAAQQTPCCRSVQRAASRSACLSGKPGHCHRRWCGAAAATPPAAAAAAAAATRRCSRVTPCSKASGGRRSRRQQTPCRTRYQVRGRPAAAAASVPPALLPPSLTDLPWCAAGLSKSVGRVPAGNNVILDTTSDEDKWRELDLQVRAGADYVPCGGKQRRQQRAPAPAAGRWSSAAVFLGAGGSGPGRPCFLSPALPGLQSASPAHHPPACCVLLACHTR